MDLGQLTKNVYLSIKKELGDYDPGTKYSIHQRVGFGIYQWCEDATAIMIPTQPMWCAIEVGIAMATGSETPTSAFKEARLKGFLLGYLGLGQLYTAGRRVSLRASKISETDDEDKSRRTKHDVAFTAGYIFAVSTPIYVSSGMGVGESLLTAAVATAIHTPLGGLYGRVATSVKNSSQKIRDTLLKKKSEAKFSSLAKPALWAASSYGLIKGAYALRDYVQ